MNYKLSLAALAVASVVSGQAMAALTAGENTALAALNPDDTWTAVNWNTSIDGTALTNTGAWTAGTDECTWRGIICSGGDITHVEIPNSGLNGMNAALAALTPAAATLQVLNVSNTAAPANDMSGSMAGLSAFTALTHLAVNNSSADGMVPDMSGATSLNWVNFADNPGITGMGAKLAGGSAITLIGVNNNNDMVGDMTATFAGLARPGTVTVNTNDSKVYGTVAYVAGDTMAVANSDIIVTNDPGTVGYNAANVVQPASGATVTPGENTAMVSWVAPATGAQTGYNVSYSSDNGVTLQGTTAATGTSHNFTGVDAGTYVAVVQSTGPNGRMAAPVMSAAFTVTDGVTPPTPPTCDEDEVLNTTTNECEPKPPTSSGGGGAAFWLLLTPLMGLLRRKQA